MFLLGLNSDKKRCFIRSADFWHWAMVLMFVFGNRIGFNILFVHGSFGHDANINGVKHEAEVHRLSCGAPDAALLGQRRATCL